MHETAGAHKISDSSRCFDDEPIVTMKVSRDRDMPREISRLARPYKCLQASSQFENRLMLRCPSALS